MAVGSRGLHDTPTKSGAKSVRAQFRHGYADARRAKILIGRMYGRSAACRTLGKATLKARRSAVSDFARSATTQSHGAPLLRGVVYIHACPRALMSHVEWA